mgnify:CR=1 FL=1
MISKKTGVYFCVFIASLTILILLSCTEKKQVVTKVKSPIEIENERFLKGEGGDVDNETFRVFFSSDKYEVIQMKHLENIKRAADPGGDKYMMQELEKHDIMNEAAEGTFGVSLYPDRGTPHKIRPKKVLCLDEVLLLVEEDIQRWKYEFPKKRIDPTNFTIKYRVYLQKKRPDEDIMKEVREKMKTKKGKR